MTTCHLGVSGDAPDPSLLHPTQMYGLNCVRICHFCFFSAANLSWLLASDALTPPLPLASDDDRGGQLWGVAIHAIHHLCGAPSRRH